MQQSHDCQYSFTNEFKLVAKIKEYSNPGIPAQDRPSLPRSLESKPGSLWHNYVQDIAASNVMSQHYIEMFSAQPHIIIL